MSVLDPTFATWRGRPVEIGGAWSDETLEDQANLWSLALGPVGDRGEWSSWKEPLDVAIGAIYKKKSETWRDAAAGEYNERWSGVFTRLKEYRKERGTTYIRFAAQFNFKDDKGWMDERWIVGQSEVDDFLTAWRRVYELKKSIFPEAKLVWCVNDQTSSGIADIRSAYPDSFVDVIAVTWKNESPFSDDPAIIAKRMDEAREDGAPVGIEQWRKFAASKNVPLALVEWGSRAADPIDTTTGGGDSPAFMEAIYGWLTEHGGTGPGRVEYELLFNEPSYRLYPKTLQETAARRYRELWSGQEHERLGAIRRWAFLGASQLLGTSRPGPASH